jgi:hypothetical protein
VTLFPYTTLFRSRTKPSHLRAITLREVITHAQVLAEIIHGSSHPTTGFIESDHSLYIAYSQKTAS